MNSIPNSTNYRRDLEQGYELQQMPSKAHMTTNAPIPGSEHTVVIRDADQRRRAMEGRGRFMERLEEDDPAECGVCAKNFFISLTAVTIPTALFIVILWAAAQRDVR
jgi:hypothetical protein